MPVLLPLTLLLATSPVRSGVGAESNSTISFLLHYFHFHFLALRLRLQDDFLASFRQSIRCCHSASDQLISSTDHIHLSLTITRETHIIPVSHLSRGLETWLFGSASLFGL